MNKHRAEKVAGAIFNYLKKSGQLEVLEHLLKYTKKSSVAQILPKEAEITTAVKLTNQQLLDIKSSLSLTLGREIKVKNIVQTDIIGGIKIRIGDKVIDESIESKINLLRESLIS